MFARQQAAAMMNIKNQLESGGVTVVAIGSGTPGQARTFAETFDFTGELYVDQELHAYKAFGLVRGFWKTLGPASLGKGVSALGKGFRQGLSAGDLWQQGGVFVIGPGDQLLFAYRNNKAGFQADPDLVIEACHLQDSTETEAAL